MRPSRRLRALTNVIDQYSFLRIRSQKHWPTRPKPPSPRCSNSSQSSRQRLNECWVNEGFASISGGCPFQNFPRNLKTDGEVIVTLGRISELMAVGRLFNNVRQDVVRLLSASHIAMTISLIVSGKLALSYIDVNSRSKVWVWQAYSIQWQLADHCNAKQNRHPRSSGWKRQQAVIYLCG